MIIGDDYIFLEIGNIGITLPKIIVPLLSITVFLIGLIIIFEIKDLKEKKENGLG